MKANNVIKKGFTLIEVVIVLAIAALIMVVVFLAVTGAQRAQRDQARKDYANAGLAKLVEYGGNNGGSSLAITNTEFDNYMGSRKINGQAPIITAAAATGTPCATTNSTTALVWVVGGSNGGESVSVCLESNSLYTAKQQ